MPVIISSSKIYEVVKKLCLIANTTLPEKEYNSLLNLYNHENEKSAKAVLGQILANAQIAFEQKRPLCQDTGFVTVFLKLGQNVLINGKNINETINEAIADAYKEFFFRKSIVSDALYERVNTSDNTPVLINTDIVEGDTIEIILSTKGGGCENISASKMLTPAEGENGIKNFVIEVIKNAGSKPCPPIKAGIGIGSNFEGSAILSKKALLPYFKQNNDKYLSLENELLKEINSLKIGAMGSGGNSTCFGVNILSEPCHIASLPVSVSISCHSSRYAKALILENNVIFDNKEYCFAEISNENNNDIIKVNCNEIDKIKSLPAGANVELSGKIYTARDAAHKKLEQAILHNEKLPFNIKNSIIFYAGPCPKNEKEIIGPIGPTTSARMDKYLPLLYEHNLLATIGKGERSKEVFEQTKQYNAKYFTLTGGVASLLKKCVKSAKIIAYEELGAEAVFELEVKDLPLKVKI